VKDQIVQLVVERCAFTLSRLKMWNTNLALKEDRVTSIDITISLEGAKAGQ